jgi:hypothetical protein
VVKPALRKTIAGYLIKNYWVSTRRAAENACVARGTLYYRKRPEVAALRIAINDAALKRPRFGWRRILVLVRRTGQKVGEFRLRRNLSGRRLEFTGKTAKRRRSAVICQPRTSAAERRGGAPNSRSESRRVGAYVGQLGVVSRWHTAEPVQRVDAQVEACVPHRRPVGVSESRRRVVERIVDSILKGGPVAHLVQVAAGPAADLDVTHLQPEIFVREMVEFVERHVARLAFLSRDAIAGQRNEQAR